MCVFSNSDSAIWTYCLQRNTSTRYSNTSSAVGNSTEAVKLGQLAKTIFTSFKQSAQLSSLDTVVALANREALLLRPGPHPKRLQSLGGLAIALYARFCRTDDITNLDEAIATLCEAIATCPERDASRPYLHNSFAVMFATRFDRTGQLPDIFEAQRQKHIIDTYDDTEVSLLIRFALDIHKQFERSGEITEPRRL